MMVKMYVPTHVERALAHTMKSNESKHIELELVLFLVK